MQNESARTGTCIHKFLLCDPVEWIITSNVLVVNTSAYAAVFRNLDRLKLRMRLCCACELSATKGDDDVMIDINTLDFFL